MCEPCPPQKCASEAWCRSFDRRKQSAYLGLWWEPPALRAQDGGMRADPATVAPPARFRPSCLSRSAAATLAVVRWGGRRAQNSRLRRSFAVRVVDHPVQRFCPRSVLRLIVGAALGRNRPVGRTPSRPASCQLCNRAAESAKTRKAVAGSSRSPSCPSARSRCSRASCSRKPRAKARARSPERSSTGGSRSSSRSSMTATSGVGEQALDLGARPVEQPVGISAPAGEQQQVPPLHQPYAADQLGEVRGPVNERLHVVARCPGRSVGVSPVEVGRRVTPLGRAEEPVGDSHSLI